MKKLLLVAALLLPSVANANIDRAIMDYVSEPASTSEALNKLWAANYDARTYSGYDHNVVWNSYKVKNCTIDIMEPIVGEKSSGAVLRSLDNKPCEALGLVLGLRSNS